MKKIIHIIYVVLFIITFNFFFRTSFVKAEKIRKLTFGIVPQHSAKKLARKWTPICNYLSQKTGYKILFKTAPNIPEFENRVLNGMYDISYMNPYHYVIFHQKPGYSAFAKEKNKQIKGIIVVRKDSPYSDIKELKGMTLAFPSPAAFAASILTRAYFKNSKININPKYVKSHDSVYRAVAKGIYPGGGGVIRTFNNIEDKIRNKLRIIFITKPYTPHAIAAHPRIQSEIVEDILEAMLAMSKNPKGMSLLRAVNFKGIEFAKDGDWDDIRGLNIKILNSLIDD